MKYNYIVKSVLIAIICFCTACETEEFLEESDAILEVETIKQSNYTSYVQSQAQITTNKKLVSALQNINTKPDQDFKTVTSDGFSIDTEYAYVTSTSDSLLYSYTFPVVRDEATTLLENVVFTFENDTFKNALFVTYDITSEEYEAIRNYVDIDLSDKITITEVTDTGLIETVLQNRTRTCGYEAEEVCGFTNIGSGCDAGACVQYNCNTQYVYTCNETADSGGGTANPGSPGGISGGSGKGGGNGGTITAPVDIDILTWNFFMLSISQDLRDILLSDLTLNSISFDFLVSESFSLEARAILEEALTQYEEQDGDEPTFQELLNNLVNCTKANALLTDTPFTNALSDIQGRAHNPSESGYEVSKAPDATQTATNFVLGGLDRLKLDVGGDIIGGVHHHTGLGYPMYSAEDVATLFLTYIKNDHRRDETIQPSDVFSGLVVPVGAQSTDTYMLKINNILALSSFLNTVPFKSFKRELNKAYQRESSSSFPNFKKVLLKTISELSDEFDTSSSNIIALYELNEEGSAFEKIALNESSEGTITSTCN